MKIVIDTHILVRAANHELAPSRIELLETSQAKLFVSSISLWEIAKLVEYHRIEIEGGLSGFLQRVYSRTKYTVIDLLPEILNMIPTLATKIGKDPADQIIVATTLHLGAQLMSDDARIIASKLVGIL